MSQETETTTETTETAQAPVYRTTATGRPTLVGTRHCSECNRAEYSTKKFEKSGDEADKNERYTLCKGVCVYCYAQKRNKKSGTSLSEEQLKLKIAFYQNLLASKTAAEVEIQAS